MGALGRERENIRVAPHQQHCFLAHMADQHAALWKGSECDSLGEIGTCRFSVFFGHGGSLPNNAQIA